MEKFYSEEYGGTRHMQGQMVNAASNIRALRRILHLDDVNSFLEIGSGYGFLLKRLSDEFEMITTGIELSKEEAKFALDRNGVDTYTVPLTKAPLDEASFDVVACFEVIEHISKPLEFINDMVHFIKPGGALVIMTDNFESSFIQKMYIDFPKWIPHQHISHFGDKTLRSAVERMAGMEIEKELSYTPWELYIRYLAHLRKPNLSPKQVFNLDWELSTEMVRGYKLFWFRKCINPIWASLTFRKDLSGALMYLLARKSATH